MDLEKAKTIQIKFRRQLLRWYDANHRDLPWRHTRDPYRIWVSEIMLQQTRVAAVLDHYRRFLERFPTVGSLARAREQSVLAAWSGLGYYRRARNLHAAAKVVALRLAEEFPKTAEGLRELPGIGRYTAAAIASIAFGERVAVVDGNVERVLQRVAGEELKAREFWEVSDRLIDPRRPGDFNQAIMELGALVCLPRAPRCGHCPIAEACATRGGGARGAPEVRKTAQVSYFLARRDGGVRLVQRAHNESLMAGMWELPEGSAVGSHGNGTRFRHSILDTDFHVVVYETNEAGDRGEWIKISRLRRLPLTGLTRKILRHFELA